MSQVKKSRRELYDEVWTTPMRLLAPKYGLSNVGLAKICKKYNIPRPWLGYWTQVKHNTVIGPDRLPDPDDETVITIRAHQPPCASGPGYSTFTNIFDRALAAEGEWPKIVVPEGGKLHEETAQSLAALREQKVDKWGRSVPQHVDTLDMRVAEKSLHRAHLLMEILLEALERRGCHTRSVHSRPEGTFTR
ncbi:MAG: hypothetical protein HN700_15430, partial [Verrucomicrobia bacterium]|nr:hypothetical protein [Verrucomicrobiota bacterium]